MIANAPSLETALRRYSVPPPLKTWPPVRVGSQFDVFDGARPVGTGKLLSVPDADAAAGELRQALHGALEEWVVDRFGDKVAHRPAYPGVDPRPDLIAVFSDGHHPQRVLVGEVVAGRPKTSDVDRLARVMHQHEAVLGLIIGFDEPSVAARQAVYRFGNVELGNGELVPRIRVMTTRDLLRPDLALLPGAWEPEHLELVAA